MNDQVFYWQLQLELSWNSGFSLLRTCKNSWPDRTHQSSIDGWGILFSLRNILCMQCLPLRGRQEALRELAWVMLHSEGSTDKAVYNTEICQELSIHTCMYMYIYIYCCCRGNYIVWLSVIYDSPVHSWTMRRTPQGQGEARLLRAWLRARRVLHPLGRCRLTGGLANV